jgi:hypothetical protein
VQEDEKKNEKDEMKTVVNGGREKKIASNQIVELVQE